MLLIKQNKMITTILKLENIKCHGCANTIKNGLLKIEGVEQAEVNVNESQVTVTYKDDDILKIIKKKLTGLGYPEAGNNTIGSKAKSFVSCAIGRMNN